MLEPGHAGAIALTGGSDDHGAFDIATTWTAAVGNSPADFLESVALGSCSPDGAHGSTGEAGPCCRRSARARISGRRRSPSRALRRRARPSARNRRGRCGGSSRGDRHGGRPARARPGGPRALGWAQLRGAPRARPARGCAGGRERSPSPVSRDRAPPRVVAIRPTSDRGRLLRARAHARRASCTRLHRHAGRGQRRRRHDAAARGCRRRCAAAVRRRILWPRPAG